jgi:RNA polymerase sigma factor (sigma-70 family)
LTDSTPPTTLFWKSAYETHGPAVLSFLRARLSQHSDAEDLLQDTFVQAIRSGGSIQDTSKVRSYLFRTAHNLMVNHIKRPNVVPFTAIGDGEPGNIDAAASHETSPETVLVNRELKENIKSMLDKLPENHRVAFQLAMVQERSYREIAEVTGWTPAQVKINVYRARKAAMEILYRKYSDRSKS